MKNFIAVALLLMTGATALAKPAPVDPQWGTRSPDELAITTEPAAATLEQNYFRAPQPAYAASRIFPCRLQRSIFDKTRLAQACN